VLPIASPRVTRCVLPLDPGRPAQRAPSAPAQGAPNYRDPNDPSCVPWLRTDEVALTVIGRVCVPPGDRQGMGGDLPVPWSSSPPTARLTPRTSSSPSKHNEPAAAAVALAYCFPNDDSAKPWAAQEVVAGPESIASVLSVHCCDLPGRWPSAGFTRGCQRPSSSWPRTEATALPKTSTATHGPVEGQETPSKGADAISRARTSPSSAWVLLDDEDLARAPPPPSRYRSALHEPLKPPQAPSPA